MVIDSQPDMEVVAEANDGLEAVAIAQRLLAPGGAGIDVVLMDVRMPQLDGLGATEQILQLNAENTRVIMLTTFDLDEYVLRAIKAGASGFLLKDALPEEMLTAIRSEEHTSELQSRGHLVCRLLLEKKKRHRL